jgi:hypothetical protein
MEFPNGGIEILTSEIASQVVIWKKTSLDVGDYGDNIPVGPGGTQKKERKTEGTLPGSTGAISRNQAGLLSARYGLRQLTVVFYY